MKYTIESTPRGDKFQHVASATEAPTWEEAIAGAAKAANGQHAGATTFWAVEREEPKSGSAAQPVIRKQPFHSPFPPAAGSW